MRKIFARKDPSKTHQSNKQENITYRLKVMGHEFTKPGEEITKSYFNVLVQNLVLFFNQKLLRVYKHLEITTKLPEEKPLRVEAQWDSAKERTSCLGLLSFKGIKLRWVKESEDKGIGHHLAGHAST